MNPLDNIAQELKPRIKSIPQWLWALTLIAAIIMLFSSAQRIYRVFTSSSWPTVAGTIAVSDLKYDSLFRGILKYQMNILYHYQVNGKRYEGDRISFVRKTHYIGRTKGENDVQQALAIYPKGATVLVHHHPSNHSKAVLETNITRSEIKLFLIGLAITLLSMTGLWRRWSLQTDYLFKPIDPDAPMTAPKWILGALGLLTCLGIVWIWWELILMYAGH